MYKMSQDGSSSKSYIKHPTEKARLDNLAFTTFPEDYLPYTSPSYQRKAPYLVWDHHQYEGGGIFRMKRRRLRRYCCGTAALASAVALLVVAILAIVAVSVYLGVVTNLFRSPILSLSGRFRVLEGDKFDDSLLNTTSPEFLEKAELYKSLIENAFSSSSLAQSLVAARVFAFRPGSLVVFFRVHLDRRKLPEDDLESLTRAKNVIMEQALHAPSPSFDNLVLDMPSIKIHEYEDEDWLMSPNFYLDVEDTTLFRKDAEETISTTEKVLNPATAVNTPQNHFIAKSSLPPRSSTEKSISNINAEPNESNRHSSSGAKDSTRVSSGKGQGVVGYGYAEWKPVELPEAIKVSSLETLTPIRSGAINPRVPSKPSTRSSSPVNKPQSNVASSIMSSVSLFIRPSSKNRTLDTGSGFVKPVSLDDELPPDEKPKSPLKLVNSNFPSRSNASLRFMEIFPSPSAQNITPNDTNTHIDLTDDLENVKVTSKTTVKLYSNPSDNTDSLLVTSTDEYKTVTIETFTKPLEVYKENSELYREVAEQNSQDKVLNPQETTMESFTSEHDREYFDLTTINNPIVTSNEDKTSVGKNDDYAALKSQENANNSEPSYTTLSFIQEVPHATDTLSPEMTTINLSSSEYHIHDILKNSDVIPFNESMDISPTQLIFTTESLSLNTSTTQEQDQQRFRKIVQPFKDGNFNPNVISNKDPIKDDNVKSSLTSTIRIPTIISMNSGVSKQDDIENNVVRPFTTPFSILTDVKNTSLDAPKIPVLRCLESEMTCGDGECVPLDYKCNMRRDCDDNSDEAGCSCSDYLGLIGQSQKICDGVRDCWDYSDENNCPWCVPGQFPCPQSKFCVNVSQVCDGVNDCPFATDERHCVKLAETEEEANSLGFYPQGYLMVRKNGIWGKLCLDSINDITAAGSLQWKLDELGKAVCNTLTYRENIEAVQAKDLSPRSNDVYYEIDGHSINPMSQNSIALFQPSTCSTKDVVHVKCGTLECGLRPMATTSSRSRIVGGQSSGHGSWPWKVALYKEGDFQCGAILVSDTWLISAGHCFYSTQTAHWTARLGILRRGTELKSPTEMVRNIVRIILHPEYVDKGFINDIALLRMEKPVHFSDYLRPLCLPLESEDVRLWNGDYCSVVGWGKLFEIGHTFPDSLQEVRLPVISTEECRKKIIFLSMYHITDNMFCAGFDQGGRDACLGDSGGPLMCQRKNGRWVLLGVTSNGDGCGRPGRPGVYTKVTQYLRWINRIMSENVVQYNVTTMCSGQRCELGRCVEQHKICDRRFDCADGSDEEHCSFS